MRRSVLSSPWIRLLAMISFGAAGMAPACDPPAPVPGGACRAAQLVSGADFACIRVSPYVVCNDSLDAGGAGLPGCYGASTLVRCWGAYGSNVWRNPATLEPVAFDGGAPPQEFTLALGAGSTVDEVRRLDRAGGVVPALVPGYLQGARQVAAGGDLDTGRFVCATFGDHRVRCEGQGGLGQLGDGLFQTRLSEMPRGHELSFGDVQVAGVHAGQVHACALLRDGSVHCWGATHQGLLGPAASGVVSRPVRVMGLPRAVHVVAGRRHTCAVVEVPQGGAMGADAATRREVRCWGEGTSGQLGQGANTSSAMPVAVLAPTGSGNLANIVDLAAGKDHTCAVVTGGAVYCWGSNNGGQLGVASPAASNRPVAVALPGGAGAFQLSAGREHTCAMMLPLALEGVPVRCWGRMGSALVTPPGTVTEELACCAPTPSNPRGICPRLQDDPANCGRMGNACAAGQSCVNGACTCPAPRRMCGGRCIDVQSDVANCGACGTACPSAGAGNGAVACTSGRCTVACTPGRGDCDGDVANGCETDTTSSPMHCGACGRAATVANGTPACRGSAAAVMACNMGFADCDANPTNGCEATLATDSNNCGRCGNRCAGSSGNTMAACAMGACSGQVCAAGFRDCNNDPTDGCESPMTGTCVSPATALPMGSRFGAGRHVVNIVGAGAEAGRVGPYLRDEIMSEGYAPALARFYRHFGDDYDFVTIVSDTSLEAAAGAAEAVRRDIPGTGTGYAMNGPYIRAGSPQRLKLLITINATVDSSPPMLQEIAHYWGVDVPGSLFPEAPRSGHWGVASVRGSMGGFDPDAARCVNADGSLGGALSTCVSNTRVTVNLPFPPNRAECIAARGGDVLPWGPVTPFGNGDRAVYPPLELYLMGLVDRAGAGGPWYVLDSPTRGENRNWTGSALRRVTMDDIVNGIEAMWDGQGGVRALTPVTERSYRTAVVVFSETPVSDAWLNNIERWSAILGNDRMDPCFYSFQAATGGRATMSTVLGATRVP